MIQSRIGKSINLKRREENYVKGRKGRGKERIRKEEGESRRKKGREEAGR